MFKSNSRFSEDRPKYDDRPKYNNNNNNNNNNSNMFSRKVSDKALEREREKEKEEKEIKTTKALAIENFPQLVSIEKKVSFVQSSSFLEKTKPKQIKIIENNVEEEIIPYGWVKISRNQNTNRLVLKYNKEYQAEEEEKKKKEKDEEEEKKRIFEENKEQIYSYEVINALNDLHFKRKQEYIDNWGYNEYEKMFLDINHDSEYFDRLDAKYEEEMGKIRELELELEIKQANDYL